MYKTTSRKIVALGKDRGGGRARVADDLTAEEYDLLYTVLHKARRTCHDRIDYITYGPRLKRMMAQIETLDFEQEREESSK